MSRSEGRPAGAVAGYATVALSTTTDRGCSRVRTALDDQQLWLLADRASRDNTDDTTSERSLGPVSGVVVSRVGQEVEYCECQHHRRCEGTRTALDRGRDGLVICYPQEGADQRGDDPEKGGISRPRPCGSPTVQSPCHRPCAACDAAWCPSHATCVLLTHLRDVGAVAPERRGHRSGNVPGLRGHISGRGCGHPEPARHLTSGVARKRN